MSRIGDVIVTNTADGATPRETATAVIADKLGIRPEEVQDDTELGDSYHEIAMVMCFKTGNSIISRPGMKAIGIFSQL